MKKRTKYNVDQSNIGRRTYLNITFDSEMEMRFYRDEVLPRVGSGEIVEYELQKSYELQPAFIHSEKKVLPITYVADFYLRYADGREEVIDIKGAADTTARIKRKLFWFKYPALPYRWLTYVKKYGGWCDWDEVNRLRSLARRAKKKLQAEKEKNDEEQDSV